MDGRGARLQLVLLCGKRERCRDGQKGGKHFRRALREDFGVNGMVARISFVLLILLRTMNEQTWGFTLVRIGVS